MPYLHMVSYSPNGQHICQAFNGQQLGALGDGVDNRLVPVVFFPAEKTDDDSTFPIFQGCNFPASLELSGDTMGYGSHRNEKFGKFLAQVLFPFHGHFLFIRTEGDRRDSLLLKTPERKAPAK